MAPISEERKAKRKARRRVKRREVAVEREMQLQAELENAQAKLAEKEKELEDSRLAIMLKEREIDNMRFTLAIQPFMPKLPKIDLTDLADPANGQSCLGEGSFGKVYLKRLRSANNSYVAVKEVAPTSAARSGLRMEATLQARVCHKPWFPYVFGVNLDVAAPILVQEFISCKAGSVSAVTLLAALNDQALLLLKTYQFVWILVEVAKGLAYLHAARILHNDLKTDNVMVGRVGKDGIRAKIIDFGSACLLDRPSSFTMSGTMSSHIAPEVARGGKTSCYSDVFSYGKLTEDVEKAVRTGHLQTIITACVHCPLAENRPSMDNVVKMLETACHH
ncbi:probable serine/threonine-protein kinase At1g01540 [Branchiostoma floridae]|uniref:Probable serine/threonine-protein kinase At1g01540 n=1 Tax=Branchiostoma floridae TaxID=7739 RepID=A0A9J7MY87_BRAFL|nr:probable serine/threonine-protein kinase At1g01540 [Branchiostoma floridae]